jgi:hypothetical protein
MNMQGMRNFRSTTTIGMAIDILAATAFWTMGRRLIGRGVAIAGVVKNPAPEADVLDRNEAIPRVAEEAGRPAPAPARITRLMPAG